MDSSDFEWIKIMVFGEDFLQYDYDKKKVCHVIDDCKPKFVYVREDWNEEYSHMIVLDDLAPPDDFSMCTGEEGPSQTAYPLHKRKATEDQILEPAIDAEVVVVADSPITPVEQDRYTVDVLGQSAMTSHVFSSFFYATLSGRTQNVLSSPDGQSNERFKYSLFA